MQRVFFILFAVIACVSCEKNITEDFRKSNDRKIALSGEFVALDTPMVHVSRTISMVDLDTVSYIDNALLELKSGEDTYLMNHVGDGFYTTEGATMEPGKTYSLHCTADELPAVSAQLDIPELPNVTGLTYTVDTAYYMHINFNFTDLADSEDYYAYYLSGWKREIHTTHFFEEDTVFIDTINVLSILFQNTEDSIAEYGGGLGILTRWAGLNEISDRSTGGRILFFSDKEINGESYNLSVKINLLNNYNDSIPEIELTFQKQDKHLLEYLLALERYDPYPDFPIMQPVQLYSNIEGGFGLVYALSEYKYTIDVSEWYNDPAFIERLNNPR